MTTIPQLAAVLQELLTSTADRLARETGFVQRASKLSGASFSQPLVMGWLSDPEAADEALAQTAATVGVPITPQGLAARLTWPAGEFLRRLLEAAVAQTISAHPAALPILRRINGVYVQDSTTSRCPMPWWISGRAAARTGRTPRWRA